MNDDNRGIENISRRNNEESIELDGLRETEAQLRIELENFTLASRNPWAEEEMQSVEENLQENLNRQELLSKHITFRESIKAQMQRVSDLQNQYNSQSVPIESLTPQLDAALQECDALAYKAFVEGSLPYDDIGLTAFSQHIKWLRQRDRGLIETQTLQESLETQIQPTVEAPPRLENDLPLTANLQEEPSSVLASSEEIHRRVGLNYGTPEGISNTFEGHDRGLQAPTTTPSDIPQETSVTLESPSQQPQAPTATPSDIPRETFNTFESLPTNPVTQAQFTLPPKLRLTLQWTDEKSQGALTEPHGKAWQAAVEQATMAINDLVDRKSGDHQSQAPSAPLIWRLVQTVRDALSWNGRQRRGPSSTDELELLRSWQHREQALPLHLAIQLHPSYLPTGHNPEMWKSFQSAHGSDAWAVLLERAPEMTGFNDPVVQTKLQRLNEWVAENPDRRVFMFARAPEALGACNNRLALAVAIMEIDRINYEMAELKFLASIFERGLKELFYDNALQKIGCVDAAGRGKITELAEGANAYLTDVGSQLLGMKGPLPARHHPQYFPLSPEQVSPVASPEERDQAVFKKELALNVIAALEKGDRREAMNQLTNIVAYAANNAVKLSQQREPSKAISILQVLVSQLGPNVFRVLNYVQQKDLFTAFANEIKDRGKEALETFRKKDEAGVRRALKGMMSTFGPSAFEVLKSDHASQFEPLRNLMNEIVETHRQEHGDQLTLPTAAEFLAHQVDPWRKELRNQFTDHYQPLQNDKHAIEVALEEVDEQIGEEYEKTVSTLPNLSMVPLVKPARITDDKAANEIERLRVINEEAKRRRVIEENQEKIKSRDSTLAQWETTPAYVEQQTKRADLQKEAQKLSKQVEDLDVTLTQEYVNFRMQIQERLKSASVAQSNHYELQPLKSPLLNKFTTTPEQREQIAATLRDIEMGLLNEACKKNTRLTITLDQAERAPDKGREHWLRAQLTAVPISHDQGYKPARADYVELSKRMKEKFHDMADSDIKDLFSSIAVLDEKTPKLIVGGGTPVKIDDKTGNTVVMAPGGRLLTVKQVPTPILLAALQVQAEKGEKNVTLTPGVPLPAGLTVRRNDKQAAVDNSRPHLHR